MWRALVIGAVALAGLCSLSGVASAATPKAGYGEGSGFCASALPGGYKLGASFDGVYACGPANNHGTGYYVPNGGPYRGYFEDASWSYQCVELANRFLFDRYRRAPVYGQDLVGGDFVATYHEDHRSVAVGSSPGRSLPVAGDVISMWRGTAVYGKDGDLSHVAVVTGVHTTSSGWSISLLEENGSKSGTASISVSSSGSSWSYGGGYFTSFQWLELGKRAAPTLPAAPKGPKVTSTTSSSATLAWTDASNNETGFVSHYRVGSGTWIAGPSVGANVKTTTVKGLKPSTSYTFQVGARNSTGTHWSGYFYGTTAKSTTRPKVTSPHAYHTGRKVAIDTHATGGVSGHQGPSNSYAPGPTRPRNSALWIVCYVTGQSIKGPYGTTTIWDLSDDGYYYTDAWIYTGSNSAVVRRCAPKRVRVDRHATGGVSGHRGPSNSYAAGPTRKVNSSLTIFCYVSGQSIKGPYGTSTIWDLSDDGYYYTDAWIYTGSNSPVVPRC